MLHRDVALRNFLVSHDMRIVVSDFGLSRAVSEEEDSYYRIEQQGILPIRWMAPEVLLTHKSLRASDVWGYGVSLWEMICRGRRQPYDDVKTSNQIVCGVCTGTLRLNLQIEVGDVVGGGGGGGGVGADEEARKCVDELKSIVTWCCQVDYEKRPSLKTVVDRLSKLLLAPTQAVVVVNGNGTASQHPPPLQPRT